MVSSNTGVPDGLLKLLQVCLELFVHEGSPIVTEELLGHNSMSCTHLVKPQLGIQRAVRVQGCLQLGVNVPTLP